MEREEIDDEVCQIMMDHGPDGHVEGHDMLTDMVMRRLEYERNRWLGVEEYLVAAADGSMSRNNSENMAAELLAQIRAIKRPVYASPRPQQTEPSPNTPPQTKLHDRLLDIKQYERLQALAKEYGLGLGMTPPPRLKDMGDGTMRFIQPQELTPYGEKLIAFALAVEASQRALCAALCDEAAARLRA